jgi:hypothetical protein
VQLKAGWQTMLREAQLVRHGPIVPPLGGPDNRRPREKACLAGLAQGYSEDNRR